MTTGGRESRPVAAVAKGRASTVTRARATTDRPLPAGNRPGHPPLDRTDRTTRVHVHMPRRQFLLVRHRAIGHRISIPEQIRQDITAAEARAAPQDPARHSK